MVVGIWLSRQSGLEHVHNHVQGGIPAKEDYNTHFASTQASTLRNLQESHVERLNVDGPSLSLGKPLALASQKS